MEGKTHWKQLTKSEVFGEQYFEPGEIKTVKIAKFDPDHQVTSNLSGKTRTDKKGVLYLEGYELPWVLNSTNMERMSKILKTNYIEDWVGRRIKLQILNVKSFGKLVPAVRVMLDLPPDDSEKKVEKIMLKKDDENWNKVTKYVINNKVNLTFDAIIGNLSKKYKFSAPTKRLIKTMYDG